MFTIGKMEKCERPFASMYGLVFQGLQLVFSTPYTLSH